MPVSDDKRKYAAKLHRFIEEFKSIFVVACDNVGSKQMQTIRFVMRGEAEILMGKNVSARRAARGGGSIALHSGRRPTKLALLPVCAADDDPQVHQGLPEEE